MKISAAPIFSFLLLAVAALVLSGCTGAVVGAGVGAATYMTAPATPPPANTADQIPEHENWCYQTMGYAECYPHPQDSQAMRLINVDPQSRYPLTSEAYDKAVMDDEQ